MFHLLAAALVFLVSACEEPARRAAQSSSVEAAGPPPAASSAPAPKTPPAAGPEVAAAVRAAMTDLFAYSEGVFAIVRENRKDCDALAARLAERVPAFRELATRMMAIKAQMDALPEHEREELKREADQEAERFRNRVPDLEDLERLATECEKSSPAFARIAPQVMFKKK
jgi:hypothetical protein